MLDRCASRLAEVLRGAQDPLQLLFPEGDLVTASSLYGDVPGARLINRVLGAAAAHALGHLPATRKLRVLEIGGGTGGATAGLLDLLPAERSAYVFTDISARFTTAAERRFARYPFMSYRTLDIERDPDAQEFSGEAPFDLIIAANVLHATRDLRQSLRHVRQLAAPGAMLLLLEGTAPTRTIDLIFGMTDGWWRFAGHDATRHHPLLSPAQWASVLNECGFRDAEALALAPAEHEVLSRQAVIFAEAAERVQPDQAKALPHWLVLADRGGIGRRLATRHQARGGTATLVHAGDRFDVVDERTFSVVPGRTEDMRRVWKGLDRSRPHEIVHLWSLDEAEPASAGDGAFTAGVLSCGSIVSLAQCCANASSVRRTLLVTRGGIGGCGQDRLALGQSGTWGLGRVVAAEHPELHAALLDLAPAASDAESVDVLWSELCAASTQDEAAYRQGVRYVPRMVRRPAGAEAAVAFRANATYLITGGLGDLGLSTARWMVARGARTLVLAGRRGPSARARQAIAELERLGAHVAIHQADVAERQQVADLLAKIERSLPPLRGIIHAAGVLDDALLRHLDWDRFETVLRPKIAGAWNLHSLTAAQPLDFFVLYSSFTAILGTPGQGNHAAANAALDALAWHRRALGLPGLSINWGAWSEIGAAAQRRVSEQFAGKGGGVMSPEQGLRLLERSWHAEAAQVIAVPVHWERLEERQKSRPLLSELVPAAAVTPPVRSDILERFNAAAPQRRRMLMLDHVLAETAQVLGVKRADGIDPQRGFFQLGMDSLTSVELRNRLGATLRRSFPTSLAFDHPTPEELTDFLLAELQPAASARAAARASVRPGGKSALRQPDPVDNSELPLAELEAMIDELAGPPS
jgi:SAM-dependent methyltransferase/acyl carrier protein